MTREALVGQAFSLSRAGEGLSSWRGAPPKGMKNLRRFSTVPHQAEELNHAVEDLARPQILQLAWMAWHNRRTVGSEAGASGQGGMRAVAHAHNPSAYAPAGSATRVDSPR